MRAVIGIMLVTAFACNGSQPPTRQQYSKEGVAFEHFSNWKITGDETSGTGATLMRFVTVEGPHDSLVMLTRFPGESEITLEEYAEMMASQMGQAMKDTTAGVEIIKMDGSKTSENNTNIGGVAVRGLTREFNIKLLGVNVPHRSEMYAFNTAEHTYFAVTQASTEDYDKIKDGVQLIFDTFAPAPIVKQNSAKQ